MGVELDRRGNWDWGSARDDAVGAQNWLLGTELTRRQKIQSMQRIQSCKLKGVAIPVAYMK